MKNKKTIIRLGIYLLISFAIPWTMAITFALNGGKYESATMQFIMMFSMLCPSIAMLLTRGITKEDFLLTGENSMMLGISLKNKKWIWYVAAFALPFVYNDLSTLLLFLFQPECFDVTMLEKNGVDGGILWLVPVAMITSAATLSFGALGEEAGWRGYMMPKLEELFGTGWSVLIGGVIWGVWHFPINMMGHNFGTGYWGEPWSGFISFTIFTIFVGAILTLLTKKTGSIWPATFLHAVNNTGASVLGAFANKDNATGIFNDPVLGGTILKIPVIVLGIIAIIMMCKKKTASK